VDLSETDFKDTEQASLEALVIDDPVVERIKHMDLDRTTPMDALSELKEIQDKIKQRER
jgi:hypothetical protein